MWLRTLAAVGVLFAFVGASVAVGLPASARSPSALASTLKLRPTFHRVGVLPRGGQLLTSSRYVYLPHTVGAGSSGTVLDEQTKHRTAISEPGCWPALFGGSWLLFSCYPAPVVRLYSPVTEAWRMIRIKAVGYPQAVGSDWIDFLNVPACADPNHCDNAPVHEFQSINTGKVVIAYPGTGVGMPFGTTIPDLNSRSLGHKLCSPLRAPTEVTSQGTIRGQLTLYDRFLLVESSDGRSTGTYLERCGSRLHRLITNSPFPDSALAEAAVKTATNPHVILWATGPQQLSGLFLPSLRPFTIRVPATVGPVMALTGNVAQAFLTSRTLYLLNGTQLWSTPSPSSR